jgi:hypothetical protein
MLRGLPTITSTDPPPTLPQVEDTIEADTTLCFGFFKTLATVVLNSPTAPNPVVASHWGSRSITKVLSPRAKAAEAKPRATVVLPTPPFRELTLRTCT